MPPELSRRSFLKAVVVTGAAATGCGEAQGRQLMPYVIPDENVIPGVPAFYAGACREFEELERILPREIGDRADLAFFPQQPVGKRRDVAHVDAAADHATRLAHGA